MTSLDFRLQDGSIVFMSVVTNPEEKPSSSEFISPFRYTWKNLLCFGNHIKISWKKNPFSELYNQNLIALHNSLYSNLKEYSVNDPLTMRKENKILETDINTDYQKFLFDFLYEQQDLYSYYDNEFAKSKSFQNLKPRELRDRSRPRLFSQFITNFGYYLNQIKKNSKQINQLKKIRWYLPFEEINDKQKKEGFSLFKKHFNFFTNLVKPLKKEEDKSFEIGSSYFDTKLDDENLTEENKEIILSTQMITSLLNEEKNEIFFLLKCLNLSITFYCQFVMNFLYTSYKDNKYVIIKEYNKRFQNFVSCAIYINQICENVNVAVNYLYETTCNEYPMFPKFSVFRMFMKTWFREMNTNISEYDTFFSFSKMNISSIYSSFLTKDFDSLKQLIKGNSRYKSETDDTLVSSTILSTSTKPSMNSNHNSVANTGNFSVTCPFGSLYEDNSICYSIIELALNSLYDTFCNEYSVYSMNLTTVETSSGFEDLEDNFIDIIETQIKNLFNKLVNEEKVMPKLVIDGIIRHFKTTFYSNRILKRLKYKIYNKLYIILQMMLNNDIRSKFLQYIDDSNPKNIKEFIAIGYLALNSITQDKQDIFTKLLSEFNDFTLSEKIKEYLVVKFIIENTKKNDSSISSLQTIKDWYLKEEKKFASKNKQVNSELASKNFSDFSEYQKMLLSIGDNCPWSTIEAVKGMLVKFEPVLSDIYYNINENNMFTTDGGSDEEDELQVKAPW